jgi:hypothetical protein
MSTPKHTTEMPADVGDHILRLKISLVDSRPRIWRRVEVSANFTLAALHHVAQIAMGWENYHLHVFEIDGSRFSIPMEDFEDSEDKDAGTVTLASLNLNQSGRRFTYVYDFGDDWLHELEVEAVSPPQRGMKYPRCTKAVRACPPEDSGGIHGYSRMLRVLRDPHHSDYEDTLEWIGDEFDPKMVDEDEINNYMREAFAT